MALCPPHFPFITPLSPVGINIIALPEVAQVVEQVSSPQGPPTISTPVQEHSSTPELCYPTPIFVAASSQIHSPSPFYCPPSAPANIPVPCSPIPHISTADLYLLAPTPHPLTPDSPINHKVAVLWIENRVPTPAPNQENFPPLASVFHPPPCIGDAFKPHRYILVITPGGEEWRPIIEFYKVIIDNLP